VSDKLEGLLASDRHHTILREVIDILLKVPSHLGRIRTLHSAMTGRGFEIDEVEVVEVLWALIDTNLAKWAPDQTSIILIPEAAKNFLFRTSYAS